MAKKIMSKISIIVPVYNAEKYLRRCVDSILAQIFTDFECILVDDGSPDNCGMICDEYAQKDKRVKVIHKENGGPSEARNVGLDEATGEYIGFVDSDDWINKDMYNLLYQNIIISNSDISCCGMTIVSQNGAEQNIIRPTILEDNKCVMKTVFNTDGIIIGREPCNKLYKREIFTDLRFPVAKLYEDAMISYQIVDRCKMISMIGDPLYYYFQSSNSTMRQDFGKHEMMKLEVWENAEEFCKEKYPKLVEQAYNRKIQCLCYLFYAICRSKDKKEFTNEYNEILNKIKNVEINRLVRKRDKILIQLIKMNNKLINLLFYIRSKIREFIR